MATTLDNENTSEISGHSAKDYAEAAELIASMGGMITKIANKDFVGAAMDAVTVIPKAVDAADAVKEVAPDIAVNANRATRGAAEKLGSVGGSLKKRTTKAVGSVKDRVADRSEARAKKKSLEEARHAALSSAGKIVSAKDFLSDCEQAGNAESFMPYSGCYVILTMGRRVKDNDFDKYKGAFVGSTSNLGAAIRADMVGLGNPDVYADVKYDQPVYALLYPCPENDTKPLEKSLIVALDADSSYNKPKAV